MARSDRHPSGTVASLWRYPVKSMAGEELDSSQVTDRGLLGDRAYALVDGADGKVATAKNPRKWPQLLEFGAAFAASLVPREALPAVRITLPEGHAVDTGESGSDATLSATLNRDVRLQAAEPGQHAGVKSADPKPWKATSEEYWPDMEGLDLLDTVTDFDLPQGTFFDLAVVHLVTTATLRKLGELYPEGEMAVRRFRPNIVVDRGRRRLRRERLGGPDGQRGGPGAARDY